ncbi:MAG: carbohydrate kinase family protein [Chloroflexota bacterium]
MLTVLGTTTVDIFIRGVEAMPEQRDDEFSNRSLVWLDRPALPTLGGNGANAAYAAGALGDDVRLWSCIGTDPFGDMVLGWLKSRNVDTSDMHKSTSAGTSTTVVVTDTVLRRNSFHYPGPVSEFAPTSHGTDTSKEGDRLLVTGYPLLQNWRGEATRKLLSEAHGRGVRTALDIGPMIGLPVTVEELEPLLPSVDILFCNEFELGEVTGFDLGQGAQWALSAGAQMVVVKRGEQGAAIFSVAERVQIGVPCFPVKAIGTVGAGDSFDAGFLYAYDRGSSLEESARFANAVAALVVSAPRGILDAPDADAVQAFLANENHRQE